MSPMHQFENLVDNFSKQLLATPILNEIGILSNKQLQYLFSQIYYFVDAFPGYLGLLLWKTNNESIRFIIAENLIDECGGMDMIQKRNFSKMHNKLLKNFIERIDTNDPRLAVQSSHSHNLIHKFNHLFLHGNFVELLSVLACMETISTKWFNLLYTQLQKFKVFSKDDLYFFKLHITLDDHHGSELQNILIPLLHNQENLTFLYHGIETVSSIWSNFYINISKEIALVTDLAPRSVLA